MFRIKSIEIQLVANTLTKNATLYVPFGSKAAYEAANYWKEFKEIIEIDTRKVLDENGITIPVVEDIVDVRVLRTINANQWSTICLPFGMNESQMKDAFGDDVELGEFLGSVSTTDGKGRVTNISVNFSKAEHIAANCPYIIKVSKPVTEFTLENEYLIPVEEPAVTVNGDKFIGGYAANTILDSGVLLWRSRRNGRNEPRCPRNESTAPQRVGRLKRKTIRIAKRFELLISPVPFRLLSFCTHKSS